MSRQSTARFAYTHERALASPMAQTFVAPVGIPPGMRAILDRLDAAHRLSERPLGDRLDAIRQLIDEEAADGQAAARSR